LQAAQCWANKDVPLGAARAWDSEHAAAVGAKGRKRMKSPILYVDALEIMGVLLYG
jgi:hypothetical protein